MRKLLLLKYNARNWSIFYTCSNVSLPSLCEQYLQCKECGISIKRDEKESHECGEVTCYNCGHSYMSNEQHLCYMRSFTSDLSPDKFIF